MSKSFFPRVKEAREALKEKALQLFQTQLLIIEAALNAGDFETAANANQWLIDHTPDEDGTRMIDISVDKPKQVERALPSIQIGFQLGGMSQPKQLPEVSVVDVTPKDKKEE